MTSKLHQFAPGPYWTQHNGISTVVYDINGRRLADVLPDHDRPERGAATVRLLTHAPVTFVSLKIAIGVLEQIGGHEDMVRHLTKTIRLVEPQERANRLKVLSA